MSAQLTPEERLERLYYGVFGTNGEDGMKRRLERVEEKVEKVASGVEADIRKFLFATIGGSFSIILTMIVFFR